MINLLRKSLISRLWESYIKNITSYEKIGFKKNTVLDHFAIIDLGYGNSNRYELAEIFSCLGYKFSGDGYLENKKNNFLWLREDKSEDLDYHEMLPQAVLADFKIEDFSENFQKIIKKYASYQKKFDADKLKYLLNKECHKKALDFLFETLINRPWPLPNYEEYNIVLKESNLIAWVLLFGRCVNHFGILVNLSSDYTCLENLHEHISLYKELELNNESRIIKKNMELGLAQSSTLGEQTYITLADKVQVLIRKNFIEFVWRYPKISGSTKFNNFYNGFIPDHANNIIESLTQRTFFNVNHDL